MEVGLLGPLRIRDGTSEIAPGGRRQRRLLARLGLEAGRGVSFDELESAVWGDEPPPTARHTVAAHVSRLRHLGLSIPAAGDGYRLDTATDIQALERLAGRGAGGAGDGTPAGDGACSARPSPAGAAGRSPTWTTCRSARSRRPAWRSWWRACARTSWRPNSTTTHATAASVATARGLTAEQPYRERRWELLMLALYRAGRQAEALDVYGECRRRLVDDLGIEPGPGLRRMQQAVLAQDPVLDPPVARGAPAEHRPRLPGTSTRLIGRSREQEALAEVWKRARAVTLVGPPGAGKTRLAVEAARTAGDAGVVRRAGPDVAPAGPWRRRSWTSSRRRRWRRMPRSGRSEELADATGLLVLDGCEGRLGDVAADVEAVVAACPGVRVLATSRERLGVFDEALIPVGPLAESDALELLVDRAKLVDPHFETAGPTSSPPPTGSAGSSTGCRSAWRSSRATCISFGSTS